MALIRYVLGGKGSYDMQATLGVDGVESAKLTWRHLDVDADMELDSLLVTARPDVTLTVCLATFLQK